MGAGAHACKYVHSGGGNTNWIVAGQAAVRTQYVRRLACTRSNFIRIRRLMLTARKKKLYLRTNLGKVVSTRKSHKERKQVRRRRRHKQCSLALGRVFEIGTSAHLLNSCPASVYSRRSYTTPRNAINPFQGSPTTTKRFRRFSSPLMALDLDPFPSVPCNK